jgi:hypothetical protein
VRIGFVESSENRVIYKVLFLLLVIENIYFGKNTEFYNYSRLGGHSFDHKVFIRNSVEIDYNLDVFYHELDHRFSITHDFKVAMILANEILKIH